MSVFNRPILFGNGGKNIVGVNYGYFRVSTDEGVGYVCVALKRPPKGSDSNEYEASFSFCSPLDRAKFRKVRARAIANERYDANSRVRFKCEKFDGFKIQDAFKAALECAVNTEKVVKSKWRGPPRTYYVAPDWLVDAKILCNRIDFGLSERDKKKTKAA